ncbi:hypothetical protein EIQ09_13245 [Xanthomonas campestris pv. campestris]
MRRSKEPSVIPPSGLSELPVLPTGMAWRNPVRDYEYDRSEWQIYIVLPHASVELARVDQLAYQTLEVRAGAEHTRFDRVALAFAFALALAWGQVDVRLPVFTPGWSGTLRKALCRSHHCKIKSRPGYFSHTC